MELSDRRKDVAVDLLLRYLEDSSHLAFAVVGRDLVLQESNSCFRKILGINGDVRGMDLRDFMDCQGKECLENLGADSIESYFRFHTDSGKQIVLHARLYPGADYLYLMGCALETGDEVILNQITRLSNEMMNTSRDLKRRNRELRDANNRISKLSGIIPICMHCGKIRDDKGYWSNLEKFLRENSEAEFSHSICEKCAEKLYSN